MAEVQKQKEMMYAVEMERERRRQHLTLIRQLDNRRKYEEREKKKHQVSSPHRCADRILGIAN